MSSHPIRPPIGKIPFHNYITPEIPRSMAERSGFQKNEGSSNYFQLLKKILDILIIEEKAEIFCKFRHIHCLRMVCFLDQNNQSN